MDGEALTPLRQRDPAPLWCWLWVRMLQLPADPPAVAFLGFSGPSCAFMSGSVVPGEPCGLAWEKCCEEDGA